MKKKNSLILDDEFIQYCKLNNIEDIEKYAKEVFNKGFTLIKYGDPPKFKPMIIIDDKKPQDNEVQTKKESEPTQPPKITQVNKKDLYDE